MLAVGLVALLPATPAAACSCAEVRPVDEAALADFDVAFTGEVTRNEEIDLTRREVDVAVEEVFKGEADAEQLVVTHAQTSACGTDPEVGSQVLFLMVRGPLSPVDDFAEETAAPDPAVGEGDAVEPDDDTVVPWVVGGVVLAVALGGAIFLRSRARSRREP